MGDRFKRLPSPSMAVAFIALLAALGGTAIALPGSNRVTSGDIVTGGVKTSDIRNSTVRGRDVAANTLTGADISESSLGTVKSATNANTASSAGDSNTVAGATVRRFSLTAPGTLFSLGGLTVTCEGSNLVATANQAGQITSLGVDAITANDTDNRTNAVAIAAGASRVIAGAAPAIDPDAVSQMMQLTWTTGTSNVTAQFRYTGCNLVYGTALGG